MLHMRRRDFITLLGGAAAWPLAASAQQFGKVPRVGVLVSLSAPHPFTEALRSGMRDLGYRRLPRFRALSRAAAYFTC
jgi:hypothetical protein